MFSTKREINEKLMRLMIVKRAVFAFNLILAVCYFSTLFYFKNFEYLNHKNLTTRLKPLFLFRMESTF